MSRSSERGLSRGAKALAEHITDENGNVRLGKAKDLAATLSVGQDLVSRWSRGITKPAIANRKKLMQLLGIGLFDWDEA